MKFKPPNAVDKANVVGFETTSYMELRIKLPSFLVVSFLSCFNSFSFRVFKAATFNLECSSSFKG